MGEMVETAEEVEKTTGEMRETAREGEKLQGRWGDCC